MSPVSAWKLSRILIGSGQVVMSGSWVVSRIWHSLSYAPLYLAVLGAILVVAGVGMGAARGVAIASSATNRERLLLQLPGLIVLLGWVGYIAALPALLQAQLEAIDIQLLGLNWLNAVLGVGLILSTAISKSAPATGTALLDQFGRQ